ncbi:hypothetical protein [Falsirhodobacter sp. alg1]|uniref:hypothetical protein n=1 Tax=Falsirhodobacter sp. alg1 TaxID=1472418 RepID=UPI00178C9F52|nr:hypothetical protein [Falsirhodobacter sp. alg1]
MDQKPKTTWETTYAAATAIMDAETQLRNEKTEKLRSQRIAAEATGAHRSKKPKGRPS